MNKTIKDILGKNISKKEKEKKLDELVNDIEVAKGILDGTFTYCKECDDYYLSGAFQVKEETKPGKILIYDDPINSGGNEYADGYVDTLYSVCPKGHKKFIEENERIK